MSEKEENKTNNRKDNQITGLSGEYFVAAELLKRDFQVSMTLGNAKSVDLIAISPETNISYKIQVKTLRKKPNCFTLLIDKIANEDFYFFVYLNSEQEAPEYHIIQGQELKAEALQIAAFILGPDRSVRAHNRHTCLTVRLRRFLVEPAARFCPSFSS